ncbi:MAG: heme-binding domain-containing protein [Campylobacterales bacterium]
MLKKIIIVGVVVLIGLQFISVDKTNPKTDEKVALHTDKKVMSILQKSCYDCHSNNTHWSIYSDIVPLSFGVVSHVEDGRKALNFSNWANIPDDIKIARLKRGISTLKLDLMPLSSYLLFHNDKKLSKEDKQILINWFKDELKKLGVDEV